MDPSVLAQWVASFSYPAVFCLLLACGVGLPLSEDVILLTGGVIAAKGGASLPGMMAAAYAGILCGDATLFLIGRKLGPHAAQHRYLGKILTVDRVSWVQEQFRRHGSLVFFGVRFLPGFRAPTYLVAGMSDVPLRKLLLADGAAALLSVPLLTFLGWHFGMSVLGRIEQTGKLLVIGAVVAAMALFTVRWVRARRAPLASPRRVHAAAQQVHDAAQGPSTP